jgi:maltose O-acetyltransferase
MGVGRHVLIMSGLLAVRRGHIVIGDDVFLNYNVYLDAEADITICDRVQVADHVRLITSTHELSDSRRRAGRALGHPVHVGEGVWIGSGATILPGVRVEAGCFIAAGAVVAASTEPDGFYAGVPARRIRTLA